MHLLILDWGAYTQADIYESLTKQSVTYKKVYYCFDNKNEDGFFYNRFCQYLTEQTYDAVFTINYFPLVAKACHDNSIKYISWSYDNPLNVLNIEDTLSYETNYVFLFDRVQVEGFRKQGFQQVFHLPLAVNPVRLSNLSITATDITQFTCDVSFVGKLYPSFYLDLIAPLSPYTQGYLNALIESQLQIYGYYLIDELLTESFLHDINKEYHEKNASSVCLDKAQLSYTMASYVTRKERLLLLSLLSKRHHLKLYSRENLTLLNNCDYKGSAKYYSEMPKIFNLSKINLNVTLKILQSGIPLRALDILGSGGALLSNYQPELAEYFIADHDFIQYDNISDAVEKANFYLKHEALRLQIVKRGQEKAFDCFNYKRQLTALFETAGLL